MCVCVETGRIDSSGPVNKSTCCVRRVFCERERKKETTGNKKKKKEKRRKRARPHKVLSQLNQPECGRAQFHFKRYET